ncbi:hypothetical protein KAR34_09370 [bacterium]|nr:hypothetical protein [bacterium]
MTITKYRILQRGIVGLVLGMALSGTAGAQLSIQPQLLVLEFQTNKELIREVHITNGGIIDKEIWVEADYRWQGPGKRNIAEWVEIIPSHFQLSAKQSRIIKLKFKKNAITGKGESHFFLFTKEKLKQAVCLNVKTGIPVFVRLNKGMSAKGSIVNVQKKRLPDGSWQFKAEIKNKGKMYLLPYGYSNLEDRTGKLIWMKEIHLRQPIPPGQMTSLVWAIPAESMIDKGTVNIELFWGTLYGVDQGKTQKQKMSVSLTQ